MLDDGSKSPRRVDHALSVPSPCIERPIDEALSTSFFAVLRRCGSSSGFAPRASHASKRHHAAEATAAGLLTRRIRFAVIVSGESGYETAAIYGEAGAGSCADTPPPNAFTIITTTAMLVSVRRLYPFRL
jgi:hypothetical protein